MASTTQSSAITDSSASIGSPTVDAGRRGFLRVAALAGGVAAAAAGGLAVAGDADAATVSDTMGRDHRLRPGQSLRSKSGRYTATMLANGNFVVLGPDHKTRWASNSTGWAGATIVLTRTGSLILYSKANRALWSSGTSGRGVTHLVVGNDGYLSLKNARGATLWSTRQAPRPKIAVPPKPKPVPSAPSSNPPVVTTPPAPPAPPTTSTGSTTSLPTDTAFTLHLLRRTTFGVTPDVLADVTKAGGNQAWLEQQLSPSTIPDPVCDGMLKRFPNAFVNAPTAHARWDYGSWDGMEDLVPATLSRQIWSKRQLFEVMVDFWSNHLNITCPSSEVWATKMTDDATVIRANALGRFDDMLVASMKSPAMLLYLSNAESMGSAPNENYGREVMELHTLGVNAGYTHTDIINVARTLSGHSVWNPWNGGVPSNYGLFNYVAKWHYVGPVRVLDWSHPNTDKNAGPAAAESLGRYLANHPATATRIATKLATRFVSDTPPASLITSLAAVYLANNTAIVPVLRALFASTEFAASTGQKYLRPTEDLIATARALGVAPDIKSTNTNVIDYWRWLAEDLGNAPLGWAPPNGYPDVAAAWTGAGTTVARWNVHASISGKWGGAPFGVVFQDLPTYLLGKTLPKTRGALVDGLTSRLLPGASVLPAHRAQLIAFLGADGPIGNGDMTWLFSTLVSLVLDSPYWSVR